MGLFSLVGDIVKLPISVVEDVVDVGSGEVPENTTDNLKEIIGDIVDTLD
jgi:hypothetical protein